jgi:tetratricopeptide (TPR) repeat protein
MRNKIPLLLSLVFAVFLSCATTGNGGTAPTLNQVPQTVLPDNESVFEGDGMSLAEAIEQSARELKAKLPAETRVAIAAFDSEHENLSGYIMDELGGALAGSEIEVADRRNLAFVYKELNFQMSGDVSDESAASIGKFLGARYVLTGQLVKIGSQYRYRLTAIDVETALQESSSRINVRDDWGYRSLLANLRENPVQAGSAGKPKTPLENTSFGNKYAPTVFREQKGRCRVGERILEYFLYDTSASGAASADAVKFLTQAFIQYAEGLGWTVDYENIRHIENNTALSPAVKALMNTRQCDVSMVLIDEDIAYIAVNIFSGKDVYAFYDYPLLYAAGTAGAYLDRGILFASRDNYDMAIQEFAESIKLNPNYTPAYFNRGLAYLNKGDNDQAIADYNQVIKLNPNNAGAFNNRGNAYLNKGDNNQAIADYNQAIRLDPNDALLYINRGRAYFSKYDFDQAMSDYTQAIKLNPNSVLAYKMRGNAYASGGEFDLAFPDLNQAIRLAPNDAGAYYSRGWAYWFKGDNNRAIADFEQALRLDPNNADVRNYLERLRREGR